MNTYAIRLSSERAKKINIPKLTNKKELSKRIAKDFPFYAMKPGNSFYMRFDETSLTDRKLAKRRVFNYNKTYLVYFVVLKHEYSIEIARLA